MKKPDFIETDYKNKFNRRLWLSDRRRDLMRYYDARNMVHGKIIEEPFWAVVPRTSIWQIPSMGTPGFDGWYGIAGDHPTDVVPINYFTGEPRMILEHFVLKWLRAAAKLKEGEDYGDFNIEHIEQRPEIGALIEDRATRLQLWVESEDLWHDVITYQPPIPEPEEDDSSDSDRLAEK